MIKFDYFSCISLRLQNDTKSLMQQTNAALQQLNSIHVVTEADQVK
jgi:hypothetical protein